MIISILFLVVGLLYLNDIFSIFIKDELNNDEIMNCLLEEIGNVKMFEQKRIQTSYTKFKLSTI